MPTATRTEIESEIARLEQAQPTAIASFAARRTERLAELRALLASATADSPNDRIVEKLLRSTRGGDRFGR